MKKIVGIFYSALMLAIAGCDTVEDSFLVGERPKENEILSLSHSLLDFKPEGESIELQITSIAKWEVSLTNNDYSQFSVTPSSGKGDGVVVVTCKPNSSQSNYNAELSGQAEIPVHLLKQMESSVKSSSIKFDEAEDEEIAISHAAHL